MTREKGVLKRAFTRAAAAHRAQLLLLPFGAARFLFAETLIARASRGRPEKKKEKRNIVALSDTERLWESAIKRESSSRLEIWDAGIRRVLHEITEAMTEKRINDEHSPRSSSLKGHTPFVGP